MIKFLLTNRWAILSVILIIGSGRLFNLNADSSCFYMLSGYLDFGEYLHGAKNKIIFDSWIIDEYNPGLAVAPLNSFLIYLSFKLF